MGQIVTRIYLSAVREVKMFNIEKRAEKVISKEKPTPAPLHPSAVKELERLKAENVSTDYIYEKNEKLDDYLKKVYITSPDFGPSVKRLENPLRPLPQSRQRSGESVYGYSEEEEERVVEGKVSLKQALQFIAAHATDPNTYTSSAICSNYKLKSKLTDDILEHFKMFNITYQKKGVDPETLTESEKLQMRMRTMNFVNAWDLIKELTPKQVKQFGSNNSTEEKSNRKEEVLTDDKEEVSTDAKANKQNDSKNR